MLKRATKVGDLSGTFVECTICGEWIPRDHTVRRESVGRICHFCQTDEQMNVDDEWDDDWLDDWDDD